MQIKKYQNSPGPISRATDEYYNGTGWHFVKGSQLRPSDPNYSVAQRKGLDKSYLVDKDGVLVPEKVRSAYERNKQYQAQLPYQEQNDINDARQMQIRQGDRFVAQEYNTSHMLNTMTLKPLELTIPSRIIGAVTTDQADGFEDRFRYVFNPSNRGFFELNDYTRQAYDQDPVGASILNLAGDIAVPTALVKGAQTLASSRPVVTRRLVSAINQSVKNAETPRELFPGQIGWAPRQTLAGYHASETPILEFDYNFPNWAVKTHNAPKGIYFTANETTPSGGFLAKRPYVQQVKTTLDRPMIQVGEVPAIGKNATRNQIEQMAMDRGADGIIYDGIADNQLKGQTIVKTLNPDVDVEIISRTYNPNNQITDNLLKFLGKDSNYRPKGNLKQIDVNSLNLVQREQLGLLRENGVDLSRLTVKDLDEMISKRKAILESAPGRISIIESSKRWPTSYYISDRLDGKEIGASSLIHRKKDNSLHFAQVTNLSEKLPNGKPSVKGVHERAINVGTEIAKQEGYNGVITGEELASPNITVNYLYPKFGLTPDQKIGTGWYQWSWDNLQPGPTYRITEPTFHTPAKSTNFNPTIIDKTGKMNINWLDPNIFKVISPILLGTSVVND